MPRILIVNCTPEAAMRELEAEGAPRYDGLFVASASRHLPEGRTIDAFTLNIADGERLPQGMALKDFDGAWLSGSPLNVYRLEQPTVTDQIACARALYEAGVPTFGSCWGLQLMTAALGGTVHLNPRGREIGIARKIALTPEGAGHLLHHGRPPIFDALCSHEDEVATLPEGGVVLASNAVSRVQSAAVDRDGRSFWGVQFHPEFDFAVMAALIKVRADRHISEGLARDRTAVDRIVAGFRDLDRDPGAKDVIWTHGLGPDVLDPKTRTLEFGNWLKEQVLPNADRRA